MIGDRFLKRPQWEKKLREAGAAPLDGLGPLNTAEWWKAPGGAPFTVPVEDDGKADFWAIQKLCERIGGPMLFGGKLDDE